MRTFVIGDLHGAHKALLQCFDKAGFDPKNDRLISLGDICDGWPEVNRCIDELLSLAHFSFVIGNHDLWAIRWASGGGQDDNWLSQGGLNTIASYSTGVMPQSHLDFLNSGHWWIEEDNRLFVHAGFIPGTPLSAHSTFDLVWRRSLVNSALIARQANKPFWIEGFREVIVGHTPTIVLGEEAPVCFGNLWLLDTGAGHAGRLTIMDIESKEFWQSDKVEDLYPGICPRETMRDKDADAQVS